jgi:hypothetical protein
MSLNDHDPWFEKWYFSFRPVNLKGWAVVATTMACFFVLGPFMVSGDSFTSIVSTAAFFAVVGWAYYLVYRHMD